MENTSPALRVNYAKIIDDTYSYMEKNIKKIIKGHKPHSELFFQIYKISKLAYKQEPSLELTTKDAVVISSNFENLSTVLTELKKKNSTHVQAWELLSTLLDVENADIKQLHEINIPNAYYILLNVWACFENWDPKHLITVFPAARSIVRVQEVWPENPEIYENLFKCIYQCTGAKYDIKEK